MDISWKRIIYLICAIQVGAGITIIGVLSFIPLYLVDLGLTNQGEAAMWAGLVSGVTPCMVALSAPFWSRKANELGPRRVMMFILATLMLAVGAAGFAQTPSQLLVLRTLQGLVGGFVPIGLGIIVLITPEERVDGDGSCFWPSYGWPCCRLIRLSGSVLYVFHLIRLVLVSCVPTHA